MGKEKLTITEGSDELVQIDVKDNADAIINIEDLSNIIIYLSSEQIVQKYKLNGAVDGEKIINTVDAAEGQVNFVIDREFTKEYTGRTFDFVIEFVFNQAGLNNYFLEDKKHNIVEYEGYIKIEKLNV
jgi:hypothetical protein